MVPEVILRNANVSPLTGCDSKQLVAVALTVRSVHALNSFQAQPVLFGFFIPKLIKSRKVLESIYNTDLIQL